MGINWGEHRREVVAAKEKGDQMPSHHVTSRNLKAQRVAQPVG